jgi:hypothetical protein
VLDSCLNGAITEKESLQRIIVVVKLKVSKTQTSGLHAARNRNKCPDYAASF